MKKILVLLFIVLVFMLNAHPASDVKLSFDNETKILTVDYAHKVSNADNHFIFEVTVSLNKVEIITQKIGKQDTLTGGSLVYKLNDIKVGDEIKVKTNCNKSGKKSGKLVIQ